MLKAELHAHTADDPHDAIPHTTTELIDRAASFGYQVLAITLHDRQLDISRHRDYARERGIVLMSGIERTIGGQHVLLINFPPASESLRTFEEVAKLKSQCDGIVVAPHAFYPWPSCLGRTLDRYPDVFDALEVNFFWVRGIDFNRRAIRWAHAHGKALVGNSDVHRLRQLGKTYSLIDAEPDVGAICQAIRERRVEVRREPLGYLWAARLIAGMAFGRLHR